MRMTRYDRSLKAYSVTRSPNGEGIMVPTITLTATFNGDLQPLARTASRRAEFGLDSTEANAKVLFYDTGIALEEGWIVEDGADRYMVSGPPNLWPSHSEAIMTVWNGV